MAKGRFCDHPGTVVLACMPHVEVIGVFWDHSDLHFSKPACNAYKSMPTNGSKRLHAISWPQPDTPERRKAGK